MNATAPCSPRIRAVLAAALLLPVALAAQTNAGAAASEDVVQLSPFEVSTNQNVGYQTNETLAGSRLRSNLSDIASSLNVFTPEFLGDIAANNEMDVMRYSAAAEQERTDQTPQAQGISPLEGIFNFRIRGQTATRARNYFETNLQPDTFNAETVEEANGPNAILFGLGAAGGIYNTSTKQARLGLDGGQVGFTLDNQNQRRATLDYNRALGKTFAVRVNLLHETRGDWLPYARSRNKRAALAATFQPWKTVTIKFDSEYGKWDTPLTRYFAPFDEVSLWKQNGSPLVANGVLVATPAQKAQGINNRNAANARVTLVGNDGVIRNFQGTAVSMPTAATNNSTLFPGAWAAFDSSDPYPLSANLAGPAGHADYEQGAYGLSMDLNPLRHLSVQLAAVHDENVHHIYDAVPDQAYPSSFDGIFGEPGQTFRDGTANPYAGRYYVDNRWVRRDMYFHSNRYRLTGAYKFDLGKYFGHHTIAALLSRDRTDSPRSTDFLALAGAPFNANPTAAPNLVFTRQYIADPANVYDWAVPSYEPLLQPFSLVMTKGAAPASYQGTWARQSTNFIVQVERAAMVSAQDYFLNDHIVTTLGFRRTLNFEQVSIGQVLTNSVNTASYGVVAKATPWLSGFFNFSQNATVPSSVQTVIPSQDLMPLNTGKGIDTGLMLKLLDGQIFVRLGYYDTRSVDQAKAAAVSSHVVTPNQNITQAMLAAGLSVPTAVQTIDGGDFDLSDVTTKGYELNLTANLTADWRLMVGATDSESVSTNLLKLTTQAQSLFLPVWQTPAAQNLLDAANLTVAQEIAKYQTWYSSSVAGTGHSTVGHSRLQVRLFTRYDLSVAPLKGVFVGGGFRYNSAPVIGYSTSTNLPFYAPVYREVDLLLGYRLRLRGALKHTRLTLQLNAENLLHQHDILPINAQGDGQIVRAVVVPPARYIFSTKLDF